MSKLIFECKDGRLLDEVKGKLVEYMIDFELKDRGSKKCDVKIMGNIIPRPKDLIKEIAESILFECGNLMAAERYKDAEKKLGKSMVYEVGQEMTGIEANQMWAWGCAMVRLKNRGMNLSKWCNDQLGVLLTCKGDKSLFLKKFINDKSHGIGKTLVDASYNRAEKRIYVLVNMKSKSPSKKQSHKISSVEEYAYEVLKSARSTRLEKLLDNLVKEPSYQQLIYDIKACSIKEKERVTLYCIILRVIDTMPTWNYKKDEKKVKLSKGLLNKAISDKGVSDKLSEPTLQCLKENAFETLVEANEILGEKAKAHFMGCPFNL